MKLFVPNYYTENIYTMDLNRLKENNIEMIYIDLDNTLMGWDERGVSETLRNRILEMKEAGFSVCIISNNNGERVADVANALNLPYVSGAMKPFIFKLKRKMKENHIDKKHAALIGDQLFTDMAAGNRLGVYTVLVKPIRSKEFFVTTFNRKLERKFLEKLKRDGLLL